jgi:hypothetical protein
MKIAFRKDRIGFERRQRIHRINSIIQEYQDKGYKMTLRQLYYQLVSRDIIPNKQKEYAALSGLLTDARMCGLTDWDAIEDRLRVPTSYNSWGSPLEGLNTIINVYEQPRMKGQGTFIEVWIEKDALSGVLHRIVRPYQIPIMVNRGYSSVSAMYEAYCRFDKARANGQNIRILYLGDHDPSGIDMLRDIEHRICEFVIGDLIDRCEMASNDTEVKWLRKLKPEHKKHFLQENQLFDFDIIPVALTREQINKYKPPRNPAKMSDPRASDYTDKHGSSSWEVDALRPEVLDEILTKAIIEHLDVNQYKKMVKLEAKDIKELKSLRPYVTK